MPVKEEAVHYSQPTGLAREVPPLFEHPPTRVHPWNNRGAVNRLEISSMKPPQPQETVEGQMHRMACSNQLPHPVFQPYQPSYQQYPHSSPNTSTDLFHVVGNLVRQHLILQTSPRLQ
ncbi:hypothetical protein HPB50_013818 [Hyalomma asiaticum]|uniref:Uncharacterized protein n=1 Tax=Hyalomma asiaticum TaxID=266040 RepID=A0ACB7T0V1_HYAAI|nr:hypothetical protein HPB50_013818 [Hyalomma asiaticum]